MEGNSIPGVNIPSPSSQPTRSLILCSSSASMMVSTGAISKVYLQQRMVKECNHKHMFIYTHSHAGVHSRCQKLAQHSHVIYAGEQLVVETWVGWGEPRRMTLQTMKNPRSTCNLGSSPVWTEYRRTSLIDAIMTSSLWPSSGTRTSISCLTASGFRNSITLLSRLSYVRK